MYLRDATVQDICMKKKYNGARKTKYRNHKFNKIKSPNNKDVPTENGICIYDNMAVLNIIDKS